MLPERYKTYQGIKRTFVVELNLIFSPADQGKAAETGDTGMIPTKRSSVCCNLWQKV